MYGIRGKIIALIIVTLIFGSSIWSAAPRADETKNSSGSDEAVVRMGTKLVTVTITVNDSYGRLVTGLDKDHFQIFDNKVKQNVEFFSTDDAPVSIAFVFDKSGSMKERINRSLMSMRKFIDSSSEKDEYCLVTFSSTAKLASDFTRNPDELANGLMMSETKGSTALYDAVYIGLEKVRYGRHNKKAVLILSDGQDNSSRYSLGELKKLAKESDVLIYSIGIMDPWSIDPLEMEGRWIMEELASITGGKAFFPSNDAEMQDAIIQVALELRRQYSIGFTPSTPNDGKWHKLKIKINSPKGLGSLSVRGREGYFARQ